MIAAAVARCDACGRFVADGDYTIDELCSLDIGGHLTQTWELVCTRCAHPQQRKATS